MGKLPSDLFGHRVRAVGVRKPSCLGCVRGGTEGMCAHMRDGRGLTGRFGGSHRCRSGHLARGGSADEPTTDLFHDIEFAAGKRLRSRYRVAGAAITRSFRFEAPEHTLSAIRRPTGDDSPVGFAQCLWRFHPL